MLCYFFLFSVRATAQEQLLIVYGFCTTALCVVLIAAGLAYIAPPTDAYIQGNFRGYFANANSLAHYLCAAAIPVCFAVLLHTRHLTRVIVAVCFAFLIYTLLDTRSRAAFGAAFISAAVIYLGSYKRSSRHLHILFFLAASALILYSLRSAFTEKYEDTSIVGTRLYLWQLHIEAILQKPLLGWGIGINPVDFKIYTESNYNYLAETEKGNSYYVLAEELGIPAALSVLALFSRTLISDATNLYKRARSAPDLRLYLLPIALVAGGLFHAVFESWIFSFGNPMAIIFWLSLISICTKTAEARRIHRKPSTSD